MKSKITLMVLCIALIASLAMLSAANYSVSATSIDLTKSTTSAKFTITNTATTDIIITIPEFADIQDSKLNTIALTQSASGQRTIVNGSTLELTISYSAIPEGFGTGIFSSKITLTDGTTNTDLTTNFINSLCTAGSINDTDMELAVDISNKGEGEDDDWTVLDNVEVEVEFENTGDEEIEDVILELALIEKSSGKNVADDLLWESEGDEEAELNDIDDGDDTSFIFKFRVPNELEEGDYIIMIKAYPDGEESLKCIDHAESGLDQKYYKQVEVSRESDDERQVVIEDINFEPSTAQCGEEVILTAKVYNIGTSDQEAVKVKLYNKDLGVDAYEIIDDFNQDDSKVVEFTFETPKTVEEGTYTFNLYSLYDYDEDEDDDDNDDLTYDDEYFDETSEKASKVILTLKEGCQGSVVKDVSIDAVLSDETPTAVAGKQVILISTIRNMGTADTAYQISVSGASSWATASVEPSEFTLKTGESKEVQITLNIDKTTEAGEKELTIKATYGEQSKERKVLLGIEKSGFASGSITEHIKSNWFIYAVILIDIILILAIILAVRRMLSKEA